jgi:uncharacterized protein YaaR (DUF327 family)
MSSTTMNQFFQEISQDAIVQQQLSEATDRESLVNKVVELGKEKGYSFTPGEAQEWLESMATQADSSSDASGELSEAQLEAVAGGFVLFNVNGSENEENFKKFVQPFLKDLLRKSVR